MQIDIFIHVYLMVYNNLQRHQFHVYLDKASKELRAIVDGLFGNYKMMLYCFWFHGPHLDFFVKQDHEGT